MNTSEIERLMTRALRADAEDAMNRTDTRAELHTFVRETQRDTRRRRVAWAGGAVAAAAAVTAVVVIVTGGEQPAIEPAAPVDQPTEAEQVATDFVEAYADFDRDLAASYLADGATVTLRGEPKGPDGWLVRNRWDQATALDLQLDQCFEHGTAAVGTYVTCPYAIHRMHSAELGRGPFGNNIFELTIKDDKIVDARVSSENLSVDVEMLTPFWQWLDETHPEDHALLLLVFETADPAAVDRSLRVWKQRTREYADAVRAGDAN